LNAFYLPLSLCPLGGGLAILGRIRHVRLAANAIRNVAAAAIHCEAICPVGRDQRRSGRDRYE